MNGIELAPEDLIEQLVKDLNQAHDELMRRQGIAESEIPALDWPEWTPQANSIRIAETMLGRRLAKTSIWSRFPDPTTEP